ncbi:hypothetical protein QAD02_001068 [Eretmocerus hayati]|uniref:Uncharacterized protein n=1 Tax=Eretmocerus hayati TaxID=131215 RepID=A0ACC2NFE4_9HYME|nr:hypothetical protein QAD02_001068 [Eretmocerus hayati]
MAIHFSVEVTPLVASSSSGHQDEIQIAANNAQPARREEVVENGGIGNLNEVNPLGPNAPRQARVLNPIENAQNNQGQATQGANNRPKPAKLTGLRQYMEKVTEGKRILDSYATHGLLKETVRSALVRLIIKREEDRVFKNLKAGEKLKKWNFTHDRLEIYAAEVAYEFDGENATTFFVKGRTVNGEYMRASGKLLCHLGYRKGILKKDGHLIEDNLPEPPEVEVTASLMAMVDWLGINILPEKTLKKYLDDTRPYRRKLLIIDKIEVHEYLAKFLCFRTTEIAGKWFSRDFDELNPGKSDYMKKQWPKVRDCLFDELQSQQLKDPQDQVKLELIKSGKLTEDETNTTILDLMPLIIDSKRSGRKRKSGGTGPDENITVKRLSVSERRDSFLHVIPTVTELEANLNAFKNQLREKHLSL